MPAASIAWRSATSASSQSAISPTNLSGRVDSSASNSSNPKSRSSFSTNANRLLSSPASCSDVQKMCESSCVKPRARSRPCTTPDFS